MKRDRHEIKLLKEIGIEAKRKAVKLEIPFYKYVENLIKEDLEKVWKLASDFEITHQNRLILGVCMPKASYLYIDITDSLKRIARELSEFAEYA